MSNVYFHNLADQLAEEPLGFSHETFRVDSDELAQWAFRKLKIAQQRIDDIAQQSKDERAKIDNWEALVSKSPLRDITFFENQLKDYAAKVRDGGRKTLVLPDGEVHSRSIPAKAAVSDKDVALKWCHENRPEWIREKEELNLAALKDEVEFNGDLVIDKHTGEVIAGLVAIEADVVFNVVVSQT